MPAAVQEVQNTGAAAQLGPRGLRAGDCLVALAGSRAELKTKPIWVEGRDMEATVEALAKFAGQPRMALRVKRLIAQMPEAPLQEMWWDEEEYPAWQAQ